MNYRPRVKAMLQVFCIIGDWRRMQNQWYTPWNIPTVLFLVISSMLCFIVVWHQSISTNSFRFNLPAVVQCYDCPSAGDAKKRSRVVYFEVVHWYWDNGSSEWNIIALNSPTETKLWLGVPKTAIQKSFGKSAPSCKSTKTWEFFKYFTQRLLTISSTRCFQGYIHLGMENMEIIDFYCPWGPPGLFYCREGRPVYLVQTSYPNRNLISVRKGN